MTSPIAACMREPKLWNVPSYSFLLNFLSNRIPLSIKTITGRGGVKLIWTVDRQKLLEFHDNYSPKCDILLVRIQWDKDAKSLFLIPLKIQNKIFKKRGKNGYIKLPPEGTNPRGAEFNKEALELLLNDPETKSITINWQRSKIDLNPYQKWVDYWSRKNLSIKRTTKRLSDFG